MVLASQEAAENSASEATRVLAELDRDGDGTITWEEFKVRCCHPSRDACAAN